MTEEFGLAILADLVVKGAKKIVSIAVSPRRRNQHEESPVRIVEFRHKLTRTIATTTVEQREVITVDQKSSADDQTN